MAPMAVIRIIQALEIFGMRAHYNLFPMIHTVLTIAGSDPSGGAGIQADLKTFSALKVYGMAVIAALTAQNTQGVRAVFEIPAEFVGSQLDAILTDIPPMAVKTGMLGSAAVVEVVANRLRGMRHLVVDPVMVSSSGMPLLQPEGIEILKRELLPLAELITPNLAEASELAGMDVKNLSDMERAARRIHDMGARSVLVKGGHLEGDAIDVFFDGRTIVQLRSERVPGADLHGTGCVLSSAIAAKLALGHPLSDSVSLAKDFVTASIRRGLRLGKGSGPVNPLGDLSQK
jgi:hydroxymethylpyrimidine kinase/phosphomethylpyrimidine kinase